MLGGTQLRNSRLEGVWSLRALSGSTTLPESPRAHPPRQKLTEPGPFGSLHRLCYTGTADGIIGRWGWIPPQPLSPEVRCGTGSSGPPVEALGKSPHSYNERHLCGPHHLGKLKGFRSSARKPNNVFLTINRNIKQGLARDES